MKKRAIAGKPLWMAVAALVCAASMWLFVGRVLIPYQVADAEEHQRPRGNLSDLYPRWLGARELLLHGRNPYSPEVARDIQSGYYGRPLDSSRPNDPKDEQGFAYPVYVVFLLAPAVRSPFPIVQREFFWLLLILTAGSALAWLRILGWSLQERTPAVSTQVSVVVLTLGSLAVVQGLKLEQMSLLVAGLIAVGVMFLIKRRPVAAGIVLAFATIKPQLVIFLLLWLGMWTLADTRRRYSWAASFLATMAILFGASEWYVPHWVSGFLHAVRQYRSYTGEMAAMEKLVGVAAGRALETFAFGMMLVLCWRRRRVDKESYDFALTMAMVLAVTVLLAPTNSVYNQVLLIPAVLVVVANRREIWDQGPAIRVLLIASAAVVLWPWVASVGLATMSFVLSRETVEHGWAVPFWTTLFIPLGVAALMLIFRWKSTIGASVEPGTS
jgi:hypothetical protein